MNKDIFRQSAQSVLHPISLLAMCTLLLNDHVLRIYWPSWWTGKLGDVAWLIFFPLVLAAILGFIAEGILKSRPRNWGTIAILLTGSVFALANTMPAYHTAVSATFRWLFGWQPLMTRDPSDLITLPALVIPWLIYQKPRPVKSAIRPYFLTAVALATFLTIANSPLPPDEGVTCLYPFVDKIVAPVSTYATYFSGDGGLSWQRASIEDEFGRSSECKQVPESEIWQLPVDDSTIYQFSRGDQIKIERSKDQGETWMTEIEFSPVTESQEMYYENEVVRGWLIFEQGPHAALYDPKTKNIVVGMGVEGILVKQEGADWQWVDVDYYRHVEPTGYELITSNVLGELWLGFVWGIFLINMGVLMLKELKGYHKWILLIGFLAGVFLVIGLPTSTQLKGLGYFIILPIHAFLGICVFVVFIFYSIIVVFEKVEAILVFQICILAFSGILFFWLPFVFWSQGKLPVYETAKNLAIVFALSTLVGEYVLIWQWKRRHRTELDKVSR